MTTNITAKSLRHSGVPDTAVMFRFQLPLMMRKRKMITTSGRVNIHQVYDKGFLLSAIIEQEEPYLPPPPLQLKQ